MNKLFFNINNEMYKFSNGKYNGIIIYIINNIEIKEIEIFQKVKLNKKECMVTLRAEKVTHLFSAFSIDGNYIFDEQSIDIISDLAIKNFPFCNIGILLNIIKYHLTFINGF